MVSILPRDLSKSYFKSFRHFIVVNDVVMNVVSGDRGGSPTAVQAWQPCPLWEPSPSHPPYNCRLGDLLCLFVYAVFVCYFVCVCICVICVFFVFCGGCYPLQLSPSVLWYCWLGLLTSKNRLPYNLYCVVGDVKHCTIQSNPCCFCQTGRVVSLLGDVAVVGRQVPLHSAGVDRLSLVGDE